MAKKQNEAQPKKSAKSAAEKIQARMSEIDDTRGKLTAEYRELIRKLHIIIIEERHAPH